MSYEVVLSKSFKQCIKQLEKTYRHIKDDVKKATKEIQSDPEIGDIIPNGSGCRKLRVANSDSQRGKQGGYRLIYILESSIAPTIFLLFLYSKSSKSDITFAELGKLIAEIEK